METRGFDRVMVPTIVAISIAVPVLVGALIFLPERQIIETQLGTFPFFHAVINFTTTLLLITGFWFMKKGQYKNHRNTMIIAFLLSAVFLVSYVLSKINNPSVPFGGEGVIRYIYFFILITHILLSAVIVPLVLFTIYRGLTGENKKHARIARWTFPIWLYVTVTGVLVYLFMAPYY